MNTIPGIQRELMAWYQAHHSILPWRQTCIWISVEDDPGTFNQAVMELGALICTSRNPGCKKCPVRGFCLAYSKGKILEFPRRAERRPVPTHDIAVGVVRKENKVLITHRKPEGLLGGLWEFPGGKLKNNEDPRTACVREIKEETGLTIEINHHLASIKHAYTHFKIKMEVFDCQYVSGNIQLNGPDDFRWIRVKDIDQYPFPKANLKFINKIKSL